MAGPVTLTWVSVSPPEKSVHDGCWPPLLLISHRAALSHSVPLT
jgi:hypothetical protein